MNPDDPEKLIDDLLEGDLSEADFLRLEAELIVSRETRQAYYDRQKLHTGLQIEAESAAAERNPEGESSPVAGSGPRKRGRLDGLLIGAIAALLILVGVLGWQISRDAEDSRLAGDEPVATGFGVLVGESAVTWRGASVPTRGEMVPTGNLELESGVAQLEIFSGVMLLIEGEAEFELVSPMELSVTRGNVRVEVPEQARGFRLVTGVGETSDLGSDSLFRITPDAVEMHVVSGSLDWRGSAGSEPIGLGAGESLAWKRGEGRVTVDAGLGEASVAGRGEFEEAQSHQQDGRRRDWETFADQWSEDPRVLAYFPMEPNPEANGTRRLIDASGNERNGTIVRASRAQDRWGRPFGGLDFSPAGSRVRVTVEGEHRSLTLACWVRIDSLDRWYNSLFLTDGHELHEPHWQIMDDGRLFFSVRARESKGEPDKHIAYSPPIWTPSQSGQWMHLATVYDGDAYTTTHYVNGEAVSIDQIPGELQPEKVVIGAASIGNWSEPLYRKDAEFRVRNLNGTIDEFALFSEALDAVEIREIFDLGRP